MLWDKSVSALLVPSEGEGSEANGCHPPQTPLLSHRAGQRRLEPEAFLRHQTRHPYPRRASPVRYGCSRGRCLFHPPGRPQPLGSTTLNWQICWQAGNPGQPGLRTDAHCSNQVSLAFFYKSNEGPLRVFEAAPLILRQYGKWWQMTPRELPSPDCSAS